jgi:hypothetical protein
MNILIQYHHFAEDTELFEEEEQEGNIIEGKFKTRTEKIDDQEVA